MSKLTKAVIFFLTMLFSTMLTVAALAEEVPSLVEALLVTEVLDAGETITAIRLEYTEEIGCDAIEYSNEHPGKLTYSLIGGRDIDYLYVNNSGEKDDIELKGKYVFINLTMPTTDDTQYRDYVTFNTTAKTRDPLCAMYLFQQEEIVTCSGAVIPPSGRVATTGEIRIGVDNFTSTEFVDPENGNVIYYLLYTPENYDENQSYPLVVHFPSGDYSYNDGGEYKGALFTHPDATLWTYKDAQAANPCFVLSAGGSDRKNLVDSYDKIIDMLIGEYNIDTSRIYAIDLAGGAVQMWEFMINHPDMFAGSLSCAYDFYHAYKSVEAGEEAMGKILDMCPNWLFAGFTDRSGAGCLGEEDTRSKGERLRDQGYAMNARGYKIDIAYGEEGELMWNGLLRGAPAEALADEQIARAEANGCDSLITLFIPGTIKQTMHWSWNASYSNASVRAWLFSQVNDAPYVPAE